MRLMRIGLLVAVCMTLCGGCEEEVAQKADGGIWGDPEISAAVEKIRAGQTVDTMRLTSKAKPDSNWKPVKKNLPKYHACLGANENPRVQFFAVAAISRLKDKSSVEPLQKFIVTAQHCLQEGTISHEEENRDPAKAAQRRQKGGLLSREESVMLQRSIGGAMETLGEIDDDSDLSVAFLGTLLKHDMPKEWGGAVAHSALAKKGAPGLRRLLEESLTAEDEQRGYIGSAISGIRDPKLVPALCAACLHPKYSERAGSPALVAIARMRDQVPEAEQFIIDILLKDENSCLRLTAARSVAEFGTKKAVKLLRDIRNAPGKGGPELVQYIDNLLVQYDTDNMIDGIVKTILSPTISDAEKIQRCHEVARLEKSTFIRHAATIETCLNVENSKGEPLNEARMVIWRALYRSTEVKHPLTLMAYENDQQFKRATDIIRNVFMNDYSYKYKGKYPYEQHERLAEEATKQLITIWDKGNTNKTEGSK